MTFGCNFWFEIGIVIGDWGLELGVGIRDWDWGLGWGWDWGLGLEIGIGDWDYRLVVTFGCEFWF